MFNLTDLQLDILKDWLEEHNLTTGDVLEDSEGFYILHQNTDADEDHSLRMEKVYIEDIIKEE